MAHADDAMTRVREAIDALGDAGASADVIADGACGDRRRRRVMRNRRWARDFLLTVCVCVVSRSADDDASGVFDER